VSNTEVKEKYAFVKKILKIIKLKYYQSQITYFIYFFYINPRSTIQFDTK